MTAKLKLFCNYRTTEQPWGGANNFILALKRLLVESGKIEFVQDINGQYDILFMNSIGKGPARPEDERPDLSPREVLFLRQFGSTAWKAPFSTTIQRKKVFFRSVNLEKSAFYRPVMSAKDVKMIAAMNLADRVVLQTRYMENIFRKAGYIRNTDCVIHNGADTTLFNVKRRTPKPFTGKMRILSSTFSDRKSKRFDLISEFSQLPQVECTHIGRWPKNVDPKNVKLMGIKDRPGLAAAMQEADVFLHPAERDPCPNVVQEALSSGLPVFFSENSGSAELARNHGVSLSKGVVAAFEEMRARFPELLEKICSDNHLFSIERAAAQYLEQLESLA
jgi:glycosyltransferase involved in cell wall biosynthesis